MAALPFSAFSTYWKAYGGWFALLTSPYLWLSGIFAAACKPIWFDQRESGFAWLEWTFAVLPSMVSFSLGAMAIFLALSNRIFLRLVRQGGAEKSYLMVVAAAFFHFIVVQFATLFSAVLASGYKNVFFSGLTFWLFIYSLACGVAAAAALLDMAEIFNRLGSLDEKEREEGEQ